MNTQQQKAIYADEGPIIIKAGPGTGKTKTLTARIEYLISEKQVLPSSILALTFTRKAATEMKERLSHIMDLPTVTTFHAFAYDILKKAGYAFEIISDQAQKEVIESLIEKKLGKEGSTKDVKEISLKISNLKNTDAWMSDRVNKDNFLESFIQQYNDQLKLRNFVDYDDLILLFYKKIKENNQKIIDLLKHIEHVLVDEFQDTNRIQYETIKLFCKPENLFVIGDPYQSIYGFRGANAEIFNLIKKDFPQVTEIVLSDNYRSTQDIIQASVALFPEMVPLKSHRLDTGKIQVITTCDEYTEAQYALRIINKHVGGTDLLKTETTSIENIRFADIAVIYRTHYVGRKLQQVFVDSGIPFQVVGEESPYKKSEIAFITALLSYSLKHDDESFWQLLTSKFCKVPKKLLRLIRKIQLENKKNLYESVRLALGQEYISSKERSVLSTITNKINNTVLAIQSGNINESIHIICDQYNIEHSIDLQQFLSCALQFEAKGGLKAFIEYLQYLEEHEFYDPRAEKVTLMTMHASKGLEFTTVCICGFEEGIIPSLKEGGDREEEKRLFYVALTRAKKYLYLIYPQGRRGEKTNISSFFEYLSTLCFVHSLEDEAIAKRNTKMKKWKEKKSQLTLF